MTKLELDLERFTGTTDYYKLTNSVYLTDGTKYLADQANCYWLMDVIASHLAMVRTYETFLVAVLHKNEKGEALFELVDDVPYRKRWARQEIEWTDFPLSEIKLYIGRVSETAYAIYLPSEH